MPFGKFLNKVAEDCFKALFVYFRFLLSLMLQDCSHQWNESTLTPRPPHPQGSNLFRKCFGLSNIRTFHKSCQEDQSRYEQRMMHTVKRYNDEGSMEAFFHFKFLLISICDI